MKYSLMNRIIHMWDTTRIVYSCNHFMQHKLRCQRPLQSTSVNNGAPVKLVHNLEFTLECNNGTRARLKGIPFHVILTVSEAGNKPEHKRQTRVDTVLPRVDTVLPRPL